MKVLSCIRPGVLAYTNKDIPSRRNGYSTIKIKRIGICGTDLHAFEGTQPFFTYPRILGHELSGELVESNTDTGFEAGEAVTFIPYFHCRHCIACRNGHTNCCVNMQVCGVHIDGGMAEYLSVPSSSLLHGNGLSFDELALIEPLAIGAHGIRRASVRQGEFVLVVGAGPIGLAAMEFAHLADAYVIVLDINSTRLRFCRDKLKIPYNINGKDEDVMKRLKDITDGDMPTVVIDATGNLNAINQSFQYMAHGARYVLIGLQKGDICFSHPEFHKREATLMSSRNALRTDFEHVIACIKSGSVKPSAFITHRVSFDAVADEFPHWLQPESGVVKAMIEMQ